MDYDHEDYANQKQHHKQHNYESPDGQVIIIDSEIFRCLAVLSEPKFIGLEQHGAHKLIVFNYVRTLIYKNIICVLFQEVHYNNVRDIAERLSLSALCQ